VSTAVALAGYALENVDHQRITQLLDYLKNVVGIRPLVNLGVPAPGQELVVLLQVGDTIFGPVRAKSISTTVVATLVTEHLQRDFSRTDRPRRMPVQRSHPRWGSAFDLSARRRLLLAR
jgi:hypothetical protein